MLKSREFFTPERSWQSRRRLSGRASRTGRSPPIIHAYRAMVGASGHHAQDPFLLLALVGAATRMLRLHTSIIVVPYRNPFITAVFTGGRTVLGLGAGYLKGEYIALGGTARRGAGTGGDSEAKFGRSARRHHAQRRRPGHGPGAGLTAPIRNRSGKRGKGDLREVVMSQPDLFRSPA